MFNCLPLYHSVGGVVATFATLVSGGAVVIRPRFSASDFWRDVRDERCTLFQYIGELCRYLVNSPHQPIETEHSLRMACGNGLRPEVWDAVPRRAFAFRESSSTTPPPKAIFRSTTARVSRAPSAASRRFWQIDCRWRCCDSTSKNRNRGATPTGFCERCAANEIGEAVGLMPAAAASAPVDSRAMRIPRPRRARCCATSSSRAIRGIAPAI